MKCIALTHLAFEDLGIFESTLYDKGFEIEYRQAGISPLTQEEWLDTDLIIVLGGPISVYQENDYPWLADQINGISSRLSAKNPIVGICLGAQLIAKALGQRVYAGKLKEIGWSLLSFNDSARGTCLEELLGHCVLHWHGDTFDLPSAIPTLASTESTLNQAFMVENHVLALQFHAEIDPAKFEAWLIGHSSELGQGDVNISHLREASQSLSSEAVEAGKKMFSRWLEIAF